MKRFQVIGLFVAAVLVSATLQAQTVDEVINKHLDAIGGKDNWRKINTMKMEAGISVQGMDVPINMYQVNNKASKQEFTVMNMTGYTIVTADSGWNFNPMMGQSKPEPMTADELKIQKDGLDIQGEFLDYKDKGHTVELMGKEDVDGTECYKVKLTRKSGTEQIYFIDPANYYIIRTLSKLKMNGQEIEQKVNLSNYQKLPEGIVVPFTIESGTAPAPINIKKVEVNPKFDDTVFKVK